MEPTVTDTKDLDAKQPAASSPAPDANTSGDVGDTGKSSPPVAENNLSIADIVAKAAADATTATSESPTDEGKKAAETPDKKEEPVKEDVATKVEGEEKVEADTKAAPEAEDPDKKLPFHEHPRWKEMLSERDSYKQKFEEAQPLMEQARSLNEYCQKARLTDADVNTALNIAALINSDPAKAANILRQYSETIEVNLGQRLPADLQAEVDEGLMKEERARELAQLRVKAQGLEGQTKMTQEQMQAQRNQSMVSAVDQWTASRKKSDADFSLKWEMLKDRYATLASTKPPTTPQDAVALAEEAYKNVNDYIKSFTPKAPVVKQIQTNGSSKHATESFVINDLNKDLSRLVQHIGAGGRVHA